MLWSIGSDGSSGSQTPLPVATIATALLPLPDGGDLVALDKGSSAGILRRSATGTVMWDTQVAGQHIAQMRIIPSGFLLTGTRMISYYGDMTRTWVGSLSSGGVLVASDQLKGEQPSVPNT